jgi:hypothetical protein
VKKSDLFIAIHMPSPVPTSMNSEQSETGAYRRLGNGHKDRCQVLRACGPILLNTDSRTISTRRVLPRTLRDARKASSAYGLLAYHCRSKGPTMGITIYQPSDFLLFITDGDNV